MRIFLASPGLGMGGAERVVIQLAQGLTERGHEVTISGAGGPLEDEVAALDVQRLVLPESGRSPIGAAAAALRLAAALRRLSPDVVHGHNVKASLLAATGARMASPRRRPRLIATFHGVDHGEYRAAARLLRTVDVVACVSADLLDRLRAHQFPESRLRLVHNAIGTPEPLAAAQHAELDAELQLGGEPVIVAVGRLAKQKNHARLLEAAALLHATGPAARYLIAGDGPLRASLERRTTELGLAGHVQFLGLRRDVGALVARADLLAFSSDWEGLSIAALEGLAAGTPIVTTPVEGMRALLGAGAAGAIAADMSAQGLAHAIAALLSDPEQLREMGRAGRDLARSSFSLDAMLDAYERLYTQ